MSCAGSNNGCNGGCGDGNRASNPVDGDYGHGDGGVNGHGNDYGSDNVCGHCDSCGFSAYYFSILSVCRPEACKISPAGHVQPMKAYDSTHMSFLSNLWKYCENLSAILFLIYNNIFKI
jgi:hypothetical protein